jgi:5-methyltetrahydrofolate--homocysteine methyltransferase
MSQFEQLMSDIERGRKEAVVIGVEAALAAGVSPLEILQSGLMAAMDVVGAKMESEDMFIPEVLRAAKTMEAGLAVLQPQLAAGDLDLSGTIVIGTVKGDLHDIGKNLVALLMASAGFSVVDLGINVEPAVFVAKVEEHQAEYLGLSALLTTTMPMMIETLAALDASGRRKSVRVLIGGAPVTQEYADQIGADGYASDAGAAIKIAKELKL